MPGGKPNACVTTAVATFESPEQALSPSTTATADVHSTATRFTLRTVFLQSLVRITHPHIGMSAPRRGVSSLRRGAFVCADDDAGMTSAAIPEAQDHYRCPDPGGPGGQRCQLLVEHDTPHIARIAGTVRAWSDGGEATLPHSPHRGSFAFYGRELVV